MTRARFALAAAIAGGAAGCAHTTGKADQPPIALPAGYGSALAEGQAPLPERWWESFQDPALSGLIEQALAGNFQVQVAWARLRGSEALLRQARATWFPVVNADLATRGQRQVLRLPSFAMPGETMDVSLEQILYNASVGAAYEVDLWGKLGAQRTAAALEARAARDQVDAAAISLSAQVADTYFNRVAQRAQEELLVRQLAVNEAFLEAVSLRFRQGLGPALDVLQQKQQVSATRAQLALVEAQGQVLDRQLALLVGQTPEERLSPERRELPSLPPLPAAGVPADLLGRRPDVRAARLAVEATDARVAAALRNRFPALNLSGSIGYSATSPTQLLENLVWSFLVGITQTVFDGGRKAAEVDRTRAALDEQVARYGEILLVALVEVESALVNERQQREHIRHLEAQLDEATRALEQARASYTEGLTDFLHVLTALTAHQRVEQARLQAERQLISYRIALHRALGGSWTRQLRAPRATSASSTTSSTSPSAKPGARSLRKGS
jgi:outer membrane protein, multidrug efflux system